MSRAARANSPVACLVAAIGLLALAAPAFAINPRDKATPLAQKEFFRPELYISSSNRALDGVMDSLPNKAAWQQFMATAAGGSTAAFIDPRSGAATNILTSTPLIPGDGVGNQVTLDALSSRLGRRVEHVDSEVVALAVMDFARAHADVLGIDVDQLGEVRAQQANADLWHVSIGQAAGGIPVRHGRLAAAISHGNLVLIGTEVWGNVGAVPAARLGAEEAMDAGFAFADGRSEEDVIARKPLLEIVPFAPPEHQQGEGFAGPIGAGYGHRLVWSFWFQRAPEHAEWEVLVDAVTGEVISFEDKNEYVIKRATGGVYPLTNTEICPTPQTCGTMQLGWPMPWANTGFAAPNNFTNSAGNYDYSAGTATSTLVGRFVQVSDTCGAISLSSASGDLAFGGANGQHDCTTPGIGGAGNTSASRACFYEVGRIKELARGWLPANAWLNNVQVSNVNIVATCNAFYSPGAGTINFYRSGGGCGNTGEIAAVFDHEWGHAMDDNDTGGALSNSSEAYADIASIFRLQASCVGHGFFLPPAGSCGLTSDGTGRNANEAQTGATHCDTDCSGVRDADWAKHVPNTPDTALGFVCTSCLASSGPCGRQVHCAAAPSRQAAWDFVARDLTAPPFSLDSQTAFIVGSKLFYQGSGNIGLWHSCTCGGTSDGCGATNGYMQWLAADDDNGNLSDGTPHMTALFAAYNRHGIACATPTPTNSGCAGGPSVAPTLTATPLNNQVSLSWNSVAGATRYWVFRTEGHAGCDFGKTLIAEVVGLTYTDTEVANGRAYSYNVVAAGASSACFTRASTCVTVTPVPMAGPVNLVATATGPNQIGLTWTPAATAVSYKVYRATGACPQPSYALLASGVPAAAYTDNTVSGGITYSYVVTFVDASNTESGFSNCDDALATGNCTLAPTFAGVTSVTSAGTPACALNVAWAAATPVCPATTVKYNVYRSLTPGFTPSAANLRQSCVTGLTYQDTTVLNGTRYYYKVRAEDSTTTGTGLCNSGNEDTNTAEQSGVPGGPITTLLDDVESGGANWSTAGGTGTNLWSIVTTQSNSPTHSWFVADPAVVTLQPLTRTSAFAYGPAGGQLAWYHRYATESTFDGYVVEYSLDGGTTWSDILLGQGSVPANPNRFLQNPYNATLSTGFNNPLPGRRAWSGTIAAFQQVIVNMDDFAGRDVTLRYRFGSDNSVSATGVWIDDIAFSSVSSCTSVPAQAAEAAALAVDTAGNGVLQPNETVAMAPTWRNVGSAAITLTGAATNFNGPGTATYTIPDAAASYGTIAVSGQSSCTATGNCYDVNVAAASRPAVHWDSTILETVTPTSATKTWTLHIGDSFADVPATSGFYRFIETILHKNVTGGCTATDYCPTSSTTREQMAVFVLVAKEAPGYSPVACVAGSELFADVPASSGFCRWIEELARRGVVSGCGGGNYCPTAPASREQMAVFVLRTLDPALSPPACVAGSEMFSDVPASSGFCPWIEELARRGVVTGCGGGNYCPTADVSREQMSVFLAVTFSITLYGL